MAAPIRFFFDFTSTFSYIAVNKIDELAARYGRDVDWSAVSLGHLFQVQGVTPPPMIPAKYNYLRVDFARSCDFAGLPCAFPDPFPPDVKLARYAFWRFKARDPALARAFAKAAMGRLFGAGQSIATTAEILAACKDMGAKRAVIGAVETAKAVGMNGAPYMLLDDEPFWGADRLGHLEQRLAQKR
jgi:2-hydroxychromene-2-carboxylate isomerase